LNHDSAPTHGENVRHTDLIRCCRLRSSTAWLVEFTYLFTSRFSATWKVYIACVRNGKYKQNLSREIWKMCIYDSRTKV